MLNLALCYETVGKTASACLTWKNAARGGGVEGARPILKSSRANAPRAGAGACRG